MHILFCSTRYLRRLRGFKRRFGSRCFWNCFATSFALWCRGFAAIVCSKKSQPCRIRYAQSYASCLRPQVAAGGPEYSLEWGSCWHHLYFRQCGLYVSCVHFFHSLHVYCTCLKIWRIVHIVIRVFLLGLSQSGFSNSAWAFVARFFLLGLSQLVFLFRHALSWLGFSLLVGARVSQYMFVFIKVCLIWFAIVHSWHYLFSFACMGKTPAHICKQQRRQHQKFLLHKLEQTKVILDSPPPQTAEEPDEYTESASSLASAPVVCSHYHCLLSKLKEEKRNNEVTATAVDEDADAAVTAGRLLPQIRCICKPEAAKAPRPCTMERTRSSGSHYNDQTQGHRYNDDAEESFGKYVNFVVKYKRRLPVCLAELPLAKTP